MGFFDYLLPVRTFTLRSGLNATDFKIALKKNITFTDSLYLNFFNTGNKEFYGTQSDKELLIRRNITYKNSFLPTIRIEPDHFSNTGIVNIKMWIPAGVMIIWIVFILMWLSIPFHAGPKLIAYGMPWFMSIIFMAAFQIEAIIALKKLKRILKLEPVI